MARRDDVTQAVTFILDGAVADAAVHAITANAMEREARIRQIRRQTENLAEGSFGRQNREAIVARETKIATGLRAIERAYRAAFEFMPAPDLSQILPPADKTSDHELEIE
jgi:hypothetical protein